MQRSVLIIGLLGLLVFTTGCMSKQTAELLFGDGCDKTVICYGISDTECTKRIEIAAKQEEACRNRRIK